MGSEEELRSSIVAWAAKETLLIWTDTITGSSIGLKVRNNWGGHTGRVEVLGGQVYKNGALFMLDT